VLDRFYQVAKLLKPNHIVRITADCPLMDPHIIDLVVEKHLSSESDYTSNILPPTYPDGLDVEIFTFESLQKANEGANLLSHREHVTPYIRQKKLFTQYNIKNDIDLSNKRWTLDEPKDYDLISKIYSELYVDGKCFGMDETLTFLKTHSSLESLNNNISRNEGYEKSLKNDKVIK